MKNFGKLTVLTLIMLCMTMLFASVSSAATLKDIDGHWAKEYIEYGVEKGYISGYTDGTFLPNKTVTRAEFSKMINNAIKITSAGSAKGAFTDVDSKQWCFEEVKKAEYAGYITGYEDGSFKPNNPITRQEAAVILSRIVLPITERAGLDSFGDGDKIDSWAGDSVAMIAAKGYIKGDEKGNFNPKGALTRSQAAKLICELVKNENIVNKDQTADSDEESIIFSETLFTDNVVIKVPAETTVKFKNCRVLGRVYIQEDEAYVELENSSIKEISFEAGDAVVILDGASKVKKAYVKHPATLSGDGFENTYINGDDLLSGTTKLDGSFANVEVKSDAIVTSDVVKALDVSDKVNLTIQSGTIEKLSVNSGAKGSTITLSKKAVVEKAENKASVTYLGNGTIEKANNSVTGVTFDGVTVDETTGKGAEGTGNTSSDSKDGVLDGMTVSPTNKKTNVSVTSNVTITFGSKVYDKMGEEIDANYVEDNFELRKGSANGSRVSYEATVSSAKKVVINPTTSLKNSTKYYVVIPEGVLENEDGDKNEEFVSYFTTGAASDDDSSSSSSDDKDDDATVTFTPEDDAEDVPITSTIKIEFSGTPTAYSSSDDFDKDYIEDEAVVIYEGEIKDDVTVPFTASISGKKVTLVPEVLLGDTEYHVVILANKIKVGGKALTKKTSSFTTEAGIPINISPENASTGVSTTPEIVVSFSEPVLQNNKNHDPLTETYIQDEVILFRKGSATKEADEYQVSYSIKESDDTLASGGRKFTIVPDDELEPSTKYYIIVQEESLYGKTSEAENEKETSYFTTAAAMVPMFYPTGGRTGVELDSEITITFSERLYVYAKNTSDRVTDDYLADLIEGNNGWDKNSISLKRGTKILDITATISEDGKTITIVPENGLEEEKTYTISVAKNIFYGLDSNGKYKANSAGSSKFDTNEALSPVFSPANDKENVAVTVNPTIKFSERIYSTDDSNRVLKPNYLKTAIKFTDENGDDVEFTASADDTTITVVPDENLDGNMTYTLTLLGGKITNEEGELKNEQKSVSFTTKVSYDITIDYGDEDYISPNVVPTVRFGTEIFTTEDDPADEDYAYDYIFISKGKSASSVDATHVITSTITKLDNRTFEIDPDELEYDTKYFINVVKNGFHYDDGESNSAKSVYFTTIEKPELTKVKISSEQKNSIKIGFTSNVKGTVYAIDEDGEIVGTRTLNSAGTSSVEIKNLISGTEYNFSLYIVFEEGIESEVVDAPTATTAGTPPECEYCDELHDTDDHECSKCGKTGHETETWCETCKTHEHETDAEHCAECEKYIDDCECEPVDGGDDTPPEDSGDGTSDTE